MEQAKALDKVRALEERMVLEAALEEEFGSGTGGSAAADGGSDKTGVWDWLTGAASDVQSQLGPISKAYFDYKLAADTAKKKRLPAVRPLALDRFTPPPTGFFTRPDGSTNWVMV